MRISRGREIDPARWMAWEYQCALGQLHQTEIDSRAIRYAGDEPQMPVPLGPQHGQQFVIDRDRTNAAPGLRRLECGVASDLLQVAVD